MSKTVTLMTRIAGEARLALVTNADGIVKEASLVPVLPIRAFESFAKGKNPYFVVEGMKRVCGVCHAVQGIAAAMAFEDALGITVPDGGALLREACGVLNRLQSHTLAQLLLVDDMFIPGAAVMVKAKLQQLYNDLNAAMETVGGAPIHSPYITIGGMRKGLSSEALEKLDALVARMEGLLREYTTHLEAGRVLQAQYLELKAAAIEIPPLLAGGLFSVAKGKIDPGLIEIVSNTSGQEAFRVEIGESTGMVALYARQMVEVGPRARMTLFKEFSGKGLVGPNEARVWEMWLCLERLKTLLKIISPEDMVIAEVTTLRSGEGTGLYEAPRGVLIHSVRLGANGRVADYRVIPPTMFNIAVLQETMKGLPAEWGATIVRLYDPCMPCEVH
ncbi:MAG: nickel-dependent hydrogenase large subunit [Bacillota bacterium]